MTLSDARDLCHPQQCEAKFANLNHFATREARDGGYEAALAAGDYARAFELCERAIDRDLDMLEKHGR